MSSSETVRVRYVGALPVKGYKIHGEPGVKVGLFQSYAFPQGEVIEIPKLTYDKIVQHSSDGRQHLEVVND